MKPQINSDFSQIRAIEVDRVKGRIASRPGMAIYAVNRVKGRIASRPGTAIYAVNRVNGRIATRLGMAIYAVNGVNGCHSYSPWLAIYAVNRSYFWNSDPCLKAWPLLSLPAAAGIRCSIPACPACAGVHPWLRNEETNL